MFQSNNFKSKGRRDDHQNLASRLSQFSNHTIPLPLDECEFVGCTNWHDNTYMSIAHCIHNSHTSAHVRITVMR